MDVVGDKNAPDENAALIHSFPIDIDQSINNEEEHDSPVNAMDKTLTSSRSLRYRQSVTMSASLDNRAAGDVTDYLETELSETEDESSLDVTLSLHRV